MSPSTVSIASVDRWIAGSPFNAWMGLKALAVSEQEVELLLPWRAELEGAHGHMHGGVLASALDAAAWLALMAVRGRAAGPTIDLRVDYHRGAPAAALRIGARVLRAGATISSVDAQARTESGALIASGRCLFLSAVRARGDGLKPAETR